MSATQNERKLLNAAGLIAEQVAGGLSPTDAVIKVASDLQLRPGEARLVSQAYNTGATRGQFDGSEDPLEKAAEFELADPVAVLEALYPSVVKTAAEIELSTAVSSDYALSPKGLLRDKQKQAIGPPALPPVKPRETVVTEDYQIKQAIGQDQLRKRAVEEARRKLSLSMDGMLASFDGLAEYFRQPGHVPLASVKQAAATVYGKAGQIVLDKIAAYKPHLLKEAAKPFDYSLDSQPLPMVGAVLAALDNHSRASVGYVKEAAYAEAAVIGNRAVANPHSVLEQEKQAIGNPLALMMTGSYAKDVFDQAVKDLPEKAVRDASRQITDPQHEAALRNIRIRSMLSDLMTEDPVIAKHPRDQVLQSYNDLNGLAPHSADQKLVVQSALRSQLEKGNVDPFEADQLLGIDSKLRQQGGNSASTSVL